MELDTPATQGLGCPVFHAQTFRINSSLLGVVFHH
jgi:hypothetical protein